MEKFRALRADEIDVRISRIGDGFLQLLLYKDARVDQNILDETVGPMNWERRHTRDNANCIVSIWDDDKKLWVSKEDTGTESKTEAEKGLASDSFKRACTNWGIGRELYSSPDIFLNIKDGGYAIRDGKCRDRFFVKRIEIKDGIIRKLEISNKRTNQVVFSFGYSNANKKSKAKADEKSDSKPANVETTTEETVAEAPDASNTVIPITNEVIKAAVAKPSSDTVSITVPDNGKYPSLADAEATICSLKRGKTYTQLDPVVSGLRYCYNRYADAGSSENDDTTIGAEMRAIRVIAANHPEFWDELAEVKWLDTAV